MARRFLAKQSRKINTDCDPSTPLMVTRLSFETAPTCHLSTSNIFKNHLILKNNCIGDFTMKHNIVLETGKIFLSPPGKVFIVVFSTVLYVLMNACMLAAGNISFQTRSASYISSTFQNTRSTYAKVSSQRISFSGTY